jgi:hypothetical protein
VTYVSLGTNPCGVFKRDAINPLTVTQRRIVWRLWVSYRWGYIALQWHAPGLYEQVATIAWGDVLA